MQDNYPAPYIHVYSKKDDRNGLVEKELYKRLKGRTQVRIVAGKGKLLVRKAFMKCCEEIGKLGGQIEFICFQRGLKKYSYGKNMKLIPGKLSAIMKDINSELRDDALPPNELEKITERVKKLINNNTLRIKQAPEMPLYHFIAIDDDEIFLQKRYRFWRKKFKRQLHVINLPEYIGEFIKKFEVWLKQCNPISVVESN